MRARTNRCRGFTWIELLGLVTVSCIVGAVVVSAYWTHSIRTQVVAGIDHAATLEREIERIFAHSGGVPIEGWSPASPTVADYVDALHVFDGRIDIVYGNLAHDAITGRRLSLTPYETADLRVIWICGNEIPPPGLNPLGFASGGRQAVQIPTTVAARYLPPVCR
jgi:type IV pilus assembly protein PilA